MASPIFKVGSHEIHVSKEPHPCTRYVVTSSDGQRSEIDFGRSGITEEGLIAVLMHRIEHNDAGQPRSENKEALHGLRASLTALERRSNNAELLRGAGSHVIHIDDAAYMEGINRDIERSLNKGAVKA